VSRTRACSSAALLCCLHDASFEQRLCPHGRCSKHLVKTPSQNTLTSTCPSGMLEFPDSSVVVIAAKVAAGWEIGNDDEETAQNRGQRPPFVRRRPLRSAADEDSPRRPEHRATQVLERRSSPSFTLLRIMLRLVAEELQLLDAPGAPCLSRVMEVLMDGPRSGELFDDDQPNVARDECVHLLLEFGARMVPARCNSPVMVRIIRERFALARVASEGHGGCTPPAATAALRARLRCAPTDREHAISTFLPYLFALRPHSRALLLQRSL
jgi:hypothetical protein